jgi:hypothetical protein
MSAIFSNDVESGGCVNLETMNLIDIELHMLATAHLWGDYSFIHPLVNKNAPAYNAVLTGDVFGLRTHVTRMDAEIELLDEEKQAQLQQTVQQISSEYKAQLEKQPLPLPDQFLEALADRAVAMGNYASAHSAWNALGKLEKGVNQYIVKGVELLQSPVLRDESSDPQAFRQTIHDAVNQFYIAARMKNPLGHQFQYASQTLHMKDPDSIRKYFKYIEAALQKEIVDFVIEYLIDDKTISARIIGVLPNAKARRNFLRYLAQQFSRTETDYRGFLQRYQEAIELFKAAKTEEQFLDVQHHLLGRSTATNESYQYLRELAVDHPISSLLLAAVAAVDNKVFLVPILMKSGQPLYEFLELNAVNA